MSESLIRTVNSTYDDFILRTNILEANKGEMYSDNRIEQLSSFIRNLPTIHQIENYEYEVKRLLNSFIYNKTKPKLLQKLEEMKEKIDSSKKDLDAHFEEVKIEIIKNKSYKDMAYTDLTDLKTDGPIYYIKEKNLYTNLGKFTGEYKKAQNSRGYGSGNSTTTLAVFENEHNIIQPIFVDTHFYVRKGENRKTSGGKRKKRLTKCKRKMSIKRRRTRASRR